MFGTLAAASPITLLSRDPEYTAPDADGEELPASGSAAAQPEATGSGPIARRGCRVGCLILHTPQPLR